MPAVVDGVGACARKIVGSVMSEVRKRWQGPRFRDRSPLAVSCGGAVNVTLGMMRRSNEVRRW